MGLLSHFNLKNDAKCMARGKAVLITGCDRGMGFETAKRLDSMGFKVLAGMLVVGGEGERHLREQTSTSLVAFKLDVTSAEDVQNAKRLVKKELQNNELWGVVNNAGVCNYGNSEIMPWTDIEKMVDINFKGTLLVTKSFLPYVRRAKGRIVNVASMNASVPMTQFSIYNATKAAVKIYTETLRYDMEEWGVKASVIMPSGYKTGILDYDRKLQGKRWWEAADEETREDFGRDYFETPAAGDTTSFLVSDDLSPVVDSIVHALTSENPKPVYKMGVGSMALPFLFQHMPQRVCNWLSRRLIRYSNVRPKSLEK